MFMRAIGSLGAIDSPVADMGCLGVSIDHSQTEVIKG